MKFRIWLSFLIAALCVMNASAQQKITINYPNRSGANWPLFLAKEGGYYQKYGLDVTLTFGVMPAGVAMLVSGEAQMVNSSLDQLMQAASKDGSLVLVGSSLNRAAFALMAAKNIESVKALKGKRIAVSQVGDAPYGYLIALLSKYGLSARDVQWIPVGTDVNGRAAALVSGRAEATLLTAPVASQGKVIGSVNIYTRDERNFSDYEIGFVRVVAGQAAIAIQNARLMSEMLEMKRKLEVRKLIERAKGILQKKHNLTEEEAYIRLRDESARLRRSMRTLAEAIILSDDLS